MNSIDIDDENYFDVAEAIHAFCSLNHSGQASELYSILSQSEFKPGHSWSESNVELENEYFNELTEENVEETFENLKRYLSTMPE